MIVDGSNLLFHISIVDIPQPSTVGGSYNTKSWLQENLQEIGIPIFTIVLGRFPAVNQLLTSGGSLS